MDVWLPIVLSAAALVAHPAWWLFYVRPRIEAAERRAEDADDRARRTEEREDELREFARNTELREQVRFKQEQARWQRDMAELGEKEADAKRQVEFQEWARAIENALRTTIDAGLASNPGYPVRPEERDRAEWAVAKGIMRWSRTHSDLMLPDATTDLVGDWNKGIY